MGNIRLKQQKDYSNLKNNKLDSDKLGDGKGFVLSDVSKEELNKRRVPVYPHLL